MTDQTTSHYDMVVIGGGIHGAGVAQAAAAAGYSVLVVEQGEVASGTSSRSSKLIHGGLRYLEHGQYALVRECLRERALLLKLAPDLVQLRPFFIPVYANSSRSRLTVRAGLMLYSLLGGGGPDTRFRSLPRREWSALDGLNTDNLRAVFQYWDAQTDDVLLTRAVMASAQKLGATPLSHTKFCSAKRTTEQWEVGYRSIKTNIEHTCTARVIVNAAGPWVNKVLECVQAAVAPVGITLVQGTHLILEGETSHCIYYLESPRDNRPVFVMPWQISDGVATGDTQRQLPLPQHHAILLGTTETTFSGDPATVRPLLEEQEYLLETYRHFFQTDCLAADKPLSKPKVLDAFAGLRVLPTAAGAEKSAHASRPRETVLQPDRTNSPQLVSIYGGKLTTYRSTSQKVLQLLAESLPSRTPVADTSCLSLEKAFD